MHDAMRCHISTLRVEKGRSSYLYRMAPHGQVTQQCHLDSARLLLVCSRKDRIAQRTAAPISVASRALLIRPPCRAVDKLRVEHFGIQLRISVGFGTWSVKQS